ncbi:hypothetical protein [Streptomyces sp. AC550_RSS872]|nr:hypothetical protein [Streptomyces sp. AC550_RSS872]
MEGAVRVAAHLADARSSPESVFVALFELHAQLVHDAAARMVAER